MGVERNESIDMKKIISRIISIFFLAFFIIFFIGETAAEKIPIYQYPKELWGIIIIFIVIIIGFFTSISSKKLGGIIMACAGAAAGLYIILLGGLGDAYTALIYGLPFIISGLLLVYD